MKNNNPIINDTGLPQGHDSHPRRRATKLLDHAKYRARRNGLECRLTREWVLRELERGTCAATGIPFEFKGGYGSKVMNRHAPSIDRIDPTKGYSPDNCQVVIYQYNAAKRGWTADDVVFMARALVSQVETVSHMPPAGISEVLQQPALH